MDPEKLFFLDKKVVKQDRTVGLIFSLAVAVLLVLVERDVLATYSFSYPAFWFGFVFFVLMGFVQYFWNPYTLKKVLSYNFSFAVVGGVLSVFIVGFLTPMVFLAWLYLIIATTIYVRHLVSYGLYGIFALSVTIWVIKEQHNLSQGDVITIATATVFVGLISMFVSSIWDLFNRSIKQLNASQLSEKLVSERLGSLINSMVDGVIATDESGRIALYNGSALNILDLNIDLHGKTFADIGRFMDHNNQQVDINKFIRETKSQVVNRDYKLRYSDGSVINLYLSVAPVHLGFGRQGSEGFVVLFRDITREKSLEEERDEFISVVSHELRTPIAIAEGEVGNAEFLVKKSGDKQVREALKQAHDQVLFLSKMINDLATLSRAEREKLDLEIEDIDCRELIGELDVDYRPEVENKGLQLRVNMDDTLKDLTSSKLYLREILQNLITNAIKYTEKGTITLSAKPYSSGVVFEVADTGIGISKGDQEKVFDKFFRSEDYRTRATNGTGLGLYVTIKLARLMNAEIDLKSELNKGSVFTVKIPNLK
ncbi:MAG TPA: ATP-binding protein [Candidatus Saccharimonadales bacterium]|nr:ATP-binding protein [Candidatus Saccharimonadales bacterium]